MIGQVMCDQMKVKADVAFNVKNDEVMGFTKDFASTKTYSMILLWECKIKQEGVTVAVRCHTGRCARQMLLGRSGVDASRCCIGGRCARETLQ